MSDETIEVSGMEYNAEDVAAAVEQLPEDNIVHNTAISGNVIVYGDGDRDRFVKVANLEDVTAINGESKHRPVETSESSSIIPITDLKDKLSPDTDTVEYVSDVVMRVNEVGDSEDQRRARGDVYIRHVDMDGDEMNNIAKDEALRFAHVDTIENDVVVSLHVDEDVL